jgi:hypothetical protein
LEFTQLDVNAASAVDKTGDTITSGHTITWGSGAILALASGGAINGVAGAAFNFAGDMLLTGGMATFTAEAGTTFVLKGTCGVYAGATFDVSGASTQIKTASGGRIVLGDNDYPTFSATRSIPSRVWNLGAVTIPTGTTGYTVTSEGVACGTPGSTISLAVPWHLHDNATLATVDVFVLPWLGAHGGSSMGSATLYRRTLASGATPPGWTSVGSVSLSGTGWGNGNIQKCTITAGITVAPGDVFKLVVIDENAAGTYTGGNVFMACEFNYSIADCRPS